MIDINRFISNYITFREESFFHSDIKTFSSSLRNSISGKSVMVIGGAGTIGSSFIKVLLKYDPARLYVADISENGLTELTRDLRSSFGVKVPGVYKTYPVNFNDPVFYRILKNEGPFEIIANFAAHKHVRSEKDHYSIAALLENNVIRAEKLLAEVIKYKPEHFFCVSTDKAANPVNVMGASKKIMEEMVMAYSRYIPVTTARFANVAFSSGSLPDGFISRIMKKQALSAPSDVKRYFVSPEESGEICLLACMLGEPGDIFFPKLKPEQMLSFRDIATGFLSFLGFEADICGSEEEARQKAAVMKTGDVKYPVYFFKSDTSGEKDMEEFYTREEEKDIERFKTLGVVKNSPAKSLEEIKEMIVRLEDTLKSSDLSKESIVRTLSDFIPGFHHIETGKNLDGKM